MWPDTLSIMGWDVDDVGLGVVFDRSIPEFVRANMNDVAQQALAQVDLTQGQINRFICHPGGAKVVDALEDALSLPQNSLSAERDVLRDFGNMSAPTVLFVLQKVLAEGQTGQMMLAALGPGFTASFVTLEV
jgi:alkylresorcinol/alkylpyrone synthase